MDAQCLSRELSWAAVAREISRNPSYGHAGSTSTITGVKDRTVAEGDGVLQMLLWLHRTPESFIPGFEAADTECFQLPVPGEGQVLRWDAGQLYRALDTHRQALGLSWKETAGEIGGISPGMLTNLAKGGRVGFPNVMRMVGWLGQPAVSFTRISDG